MKIDFGLQDILLVSPILALLVTSMIPLTIKVLRGNREQESSATLFQSLVGIAVAIILSVVFSGTGKTVFSRALIFDGISMWMSVMTLLITAGSLFLAHENVATRGRQFSELVFLILGSTIGMLIMIWSNDLLTLFIGLETMSLPLYLIIGMSHEEKLSKEASLKYFILGSFASAVFLYGVAMIFGVVGSTYFSEIAKVAEEFSSVNRLFLFGLTLLSLGFCFKVSIFPFHAWTPDVYQGSATPITSYMATAVKAVSFIAFLRIALMQGFLGSEELFDTLQWLAVLTMIVGNVAAILQDNFKRMLAYSSVAHSGYALVGIIAAGVGGDAGLGASGLIFYMFSYSIMTLGAFAIVCLFEKNENDSLSVTDFKGFSSKHPWYALALTVIMLSLAGIPPTVGFFGKFYLFTAAIGEGLLWLALWGVIGSVISVYYYLRPVVLMYMSDGAEEQPIIELRKGLNGTKLVVWITVLLVILIGLMSSPFYYMVESSVRNI